MQSDMEALIAKLFKRGFNPDGIVYVLRLMADEHPEGSERHKELEAAAQYFLE